MASRKEQKEQARQQRLAQEQAAAERAKRVRRLQVFGGVVVIAVIVIVVAVVISSGSGGSAVKPQSQAAKAAASHVNTLLAGIPQSGDTLGKPSAPVTITEYGDLECSVCDVLATPSSFKNPEGESGSGWEDQLIDNYVKTGKAKLVYKSLETASSENPDSGAFQQQQVAAYAAGLQGKAWDYIELMYNEQGQEGSNYVTPTYLEDLAKQIPGLNFKKWMADRNLASLKNRLTLENQQGTGVDGGSASTPTVVITGPGGKSAAPIVGLPNGGYNAYATAINSVA
ncbi:MAG: DsbA family protein [Conexibacteraceae bacterium]|nr:DsbA family protein [Conexibacteraceae bacterium]